MKKLCFVYCGDQCDCQEPIVTHMDIVSWIEGWDLVRSDTVNNLENEEELEDE